MIEITLNKNEFINSFLNPIKKVNINGSCSIYSKNNEIISLSTSEDKVCSLFSKFKPENEIPDFERVNIADVKRLILALKFVETDEVTLKMDGEKLWYDTKKFKFETYLLDSKFVEKIAMNPDKIDALETHVVFPVSKNSMKDLKIAKMVAPDATKMYFIADEDKVFINLNDKKKSKIDNASLLISENMSGTLTEPFIINGAIFNMVSQFDEDLIFKLNTKLGVLFIETATEKMKLKYITSVLTK